LPFQDTKERWVERLKFICQGRRNVIQSDAKPRQRSP
jgi:hypothetical protein